MTWEKNGNLKPIYFYDDDTNVEHLSGVNEIIVNSIIEHTIKNIDNNAYISMNSIITDNNLARDNTEKDNIGKNFRRFISKNKEWRVFTSADGRNGGYRISVFNVLPSTIDARLQWIESIILADGAFLTAMVKCEEILKSDPTNAKAYFYMLLANLHCEKRTDLANLPESFEDNEYYAKVIQYGDDSLKSELVRYINAIKLRNTTRYSSLKVGEEIYFGTHNGQSISWRVLRIQEQKALIITVNTIDYRAYHEPYGDISWGDCTLRKWLSNEFIRGHFTKTERNRILLCKLNTDNNPKYKTPGGPPTLNKIFLLSKSEAESLFANDEARSTGTSWWLRTPGFLPNEAIYVNDKGRINIGGKFVANSDGVRPALWLKLD